MSGSRWSTWLDLAGRLLDLIAELVASGASDEEIRARLADPLGVGQQLIDAVRARSGKIRDYVERG